VRILLDTHALLWYVLGDSRLSDQARKVAIDLANEVLISPASYWEIAIKISAGKYTLNQPFEKFIDLCLNQYGFMILPIEPRHAFRVATLPFFKTHKDPFDRLLVAQAHSENIPIVSADTQLDIYGVTRLW
jgi:PIN domain nuclease of toxin-antitoxin system